MKKLLSVFALTAVLFISLSAHTERVFEAEEGYMAPQFTINAGDSTLSLTGLQGNCVLLTFWDSTQPESRIDANRYNAIAARSADRGIRHIAVNFDRSESLFREIVRRDSLNPAEQINVTGDEASALKEAYRLNQGCRTFLIDPSGKIIAVNPTEQQILAAV